MSDDNFQQYLSPSDSFINQKQEQNIEFLKMSEDFNHDINIKKSEEKGILKKEKLHKLIPIKELFIEFNKIIEQKLSKENAMKCKIHLEEETPDQCNDCMNLKIKITQESYQPEGKFIESVVLDNIGRIMKSI